MDHYPDEAAHANAVSKEGERLINLQAQSENADVDVEYDNLIIEATAFLESEIPEVIRGSAFYKMYEGWFIDGVTWLWDKSVNELRID